jgi:hypothetical protein
MNTKKNNGGIDGAADTTGPAERFNYLAAAEMGAEQNYNSIDGIINNESKPSILEQLRQNKAKPPERGGKPDRTTAAER